MGESQGQRGALNRPVRIVATVGAVSRGQWLSSAEGVRWHFDAGADSLDFAHTGALGAESLHSARDLDAWLADRFPGLAPASERDLVDALHLRAAIAMLATAVADGRDLAADDIDTLNLFAALPDVPPALDGGRRQPGAGRLRVAQALSSLARDAITVLQTGSGRLRRCAADDCRMLFRDESRTRSRRWCSMARCGNRAKVRAHRARRAPANA